MADCVLDSSAILAWIGGEQGHEAIEPHLADAACSANIVAEVFAKLVDWGWSAPAIDRALIELSFNVHPVTEEDAVQIGLLRAPTRAAGLSLGDRSCLALAARLALPAITVDRGWAKVADAVGVEVRVLR